jgi:hypothetical protein
MNNEVRRVCHFMPIGIRALPCVRQSTRTVLTTVVRGVSSALCLRLFHGDLSSVLVVMLKPRDRQLTCQAPATPWTYLHTTSGCKAGL